MLSKWDERYSEPGFAYGTSPNDFLAASLIHLPLPAGHILCLAEGEGRNAVFLAEQGYTVTAVDSSAVGLKKAQSLAAKRGVAISTCVADLADFLLPANSYDAIVSIFCHLPPLVRQKLYRQIPSSLKPGGVFLLEGYTPRQLQYGTGGPPIRELLVELDDLREDLQSLHIVSAIEVRREIFEGRLHTGLGEVAQVIAVKKENGKTQQKNRG